MDRADEVLDGRRRCAAVYDELLADLPWLRRPIVPEGYVHGYQAYVCLFAPEEPTLANVHELHRRRNALMTELERRGISTRQGTHSPVLTGLYARKYGLRPEDYRASVIADRLSLALPLFPQLTEDEQQTVADELRAAFD
jgi:dTDP-4-amino-4,6-dideoxygalactose transaminase